MLGRHQQPVKRLVIAAGEQAHVGGRPNAKARDLVAPELEDLLPEFLLALSNRHLSRHPGAKVSNGELSAVA